MFYPSAKIILHPPDDKNKILLIKRHLNQTNYYEPAGGKVEIDFEKRVAENLEECAIREIKEELGVTVLLEKYIGSYYFFWTIDSSKCSLCAVFVGSIVSQDSQFIMNADTCELPIEPAWVTVDDILKKRIAINPSFVGLENLLINYCGTISK